MDPKNHPYHKTEGEYCPVCLIGKIIRKNGPYSDFLACERYPRCNFVSMAKVPLSSNGQLDQEADDWLANNKLSKKNHDRDKKNGLGKATTQKGEPRSHKR